MPTSQKADYSVGTQAAAWKKDVWHTVSGLPRPATPRRCALPSAPPWHIRISRAIARAIAARLAAAISCCWSASIAPLKRGRWPASSNATCVSTITCRSTTSAPLATHLKRASCVTSWTRHSTRFARWSRRSKSGATRHRGWKFFVAFQASTSRAKSIVGPTTGPSGAGTASERAKTSRPHSKRNLGGCKIVGHVRRSRRAPRQMAQTEAHVPMVLLEVRGRAVAPRGQTVPPAALAPAARAAVAPHDLPVDRLTPTPDPRLTVDGIRHSRRWWLIP